jgi:transporter family-2 protein
MNPSALIFPLLALCAAMVLPVQAAINAQLARGLGNPFAATAISFATGALAMGILTLLVSRELPSFAAIAKIPLWVIFAGGVLGTIYVIGNILLVPKLGTAVLFAFAIAGQLLAALVIDQYGLLGLAVRELSLGRIAGVAMVLAGAVMVRVL